MKDSKDYAKRVGSFFKKVGKKSLLTLPLSDDKIDIVVYAGLYEYLLSDDVGL